MIRKLAKGRYLAALGMMLVASVATLFWLKERYDLTAIAQVTYDTFVYRFTDRAFASQEEIRAGIRNVREDSLLNAAPMAPTRGPLRRDSLVKHYFVDRQGEPVYLAGSHTWSSLQDNGGGWPPPAFDFSLYLDFLAAHGHNLTRLWAWETPRWSVQTPDPTYWFDPMPFERTGPGEALDGLAKWDLTRFNQAYFDRLRRRVELAGERGIYVAVMLFNGWSVAEKGRPFGRSTWRSHPLHAPNNINGLSGDADGDGDGSEVHELGDPDILALQKSYVRKVIDTLDGLDNVLYEISNESDSESVDWQHHMIGFIDAYQADKELQNPVGMSVTYPGGSDDSLVRSGAGWIAPRNSSSDLVLEAEEIVIADSDHIFGIGGDARWVWSEFLRGHNPLFMDGYDGAGYGVGGAGFDFALERWDDLRRNLGYTRTVAADLGLEGLSPQPSVCPDTECLVRTEEGRFALLTLIADGRSAVDLQLSRSAAEATAVPTWLSTQTGIVTEQEPIRLGFQMSLSPPGEHFQVLILRQVPE